MVPTGPDYSLPDFIADLGGQWGDVDGATNIHADDANHESVEKMLKALEKEIPNLKDILKE